MIDGLGRLAQVEKSIPRVVMGFGVFGLQVQGALEGRDRFIRSAVRPERRAQVVVRGRVVGHEGNRTTVVIRCLFEPAVELERDSKIGFADG
jgi:hypothetical protein